jgi:hypothetical protein
MKVTTIGRWDEPEQASTARGWLKSEQGICVGFYLDYGPDHYRSGHEYCSESRPCPECQPGTVLACSYPGGPGSKTVSAYCETVADARRFVYYRA